MKFITVVPVAPLRREPSHKSEMVSQLLFGEICTQSDIQNEFVEVRGEYDGYTGWVQVQQLSPIDTAVNDEWKVLTRSVTQGALVDGQPLSLSAGSECYFKANHHAGTSREVLHLPNHIIAYSAGLLKQVEDKAGFKSPVDAARQYLGAPYLWGGKSIWGIDCSGLTQMAFKLIGFFMPRDAWQQAEGGETVGFLQEALPGDLAFFDNDEGRIIHVGLMLAPGQILHASGMVRIDPIDHHGIVHAQTGRRTHSLRVIKRYL